MATELADGLWWLDLGSVNCYLADEAVPRATDDRFGGRTASGDDGSLTLVDAGTPFDHGEVAAGVREAGYEVEDVDRVLVTHYDFDHVGSLARLPGLDAPVHVGSADAPFVSGDGRPNWRNHKGALQRAADPLLPRPDLPVRPVEDGDEIGSFTAYHTPGHTPGHVAYVSESLDAAFLGDLVMEDHGELTPSSRLLSYDANAVRESVRSLVRRAPPFSVAAPGHGVPFYRDGSERLRELAETL